MFDEYIGSFSKKKEPNFYIVVDHDLDFRRAHIQRHSMWIGRLGPETTRAKFRAIHAPTKAYALWR